jgi:hypothetical protein
MRGQNECQETFSEIFGPVHPQGKTRLETAALLLRELTRASNWRSISTVSGQTISSRVAWVSDPLIKRLKREQYSTRLLKSDHSKMDAAGIPARSTSE